TALGRGRAARAGAQPGRPASTSGDACGPGPDRDDATRNAHLPVGSDTGMAHHAHTLLGSYATPLFRYGDVVRVRRSVPPGWHAWPGRHPNGAACRQNCPKITSWMWERTCCWQIRAV